ncbi:MAG: gamma carbonic anhydrase family protein [Gammaproteobacteria bacterium]
MNDAVRPLGDTAPVLGERVFVDPSSVVIGDVTLGDDVSIWPMAVVRGDVNYIRVGARTNVQDGSVFHVAHAGEFGPGAPLIVGEDVTVGHKAVLHACTVGDRCLIGINAVVMDHAVVEDDVLLAAGSLVTPRKVLRAGWLYAGSPAKAMRELKPEEVAMLKYSARHYVKVKDRHRAG